MKIYIGSDHNGYHLKHDVSEYLKSQNLAVEIIGKDELDPNDDFPILAAEVIHAVLASDDTDPRGILICGSGQGMVIAANRFKKIRAGLGWSKTAAHSIRNDEDSNVLALPAELFIDSNDWKEVVDVWLRTPFANAPRYRRRNQELDDLV